MSHDLASLLQKTITTELPELRSVNEEQASAEPSRPGAWTKKEELGHLIDSATNNHVRFVRMALEDDYRGPSYAQDNWVALHGYREIPWASIVNLWNQYNWLLVHLIARISEPRLQIKASIGAGTPVTLQFLIEDYVLHMQHHLDHVLSRGKITPYPRV
jgi:DinB superfamily